MRYQQEKPETVEAKAILRLVSLGATTLEGARELISVPDNQRTVLGAFVAVSGKAGASIGYALMFRERVLREFERLLAFSAGEGNSPSVVQ
jgi:hypothetical protein